MSIFKPKSAADQLAEVLRGEAEVVAARWYRNKPATRKLLLTIVGDWGVEHPTTVLVPEGSHELYDSFARVL